LNTFAASSENVTKVAKFIFAHDVNVIAVWKILIIIIIIMTTIKNRNKDDNKLAITITNAMCGIIS